MNDIADKLGLPLAHVIYTFKKDWTSTLERKAGQIIRESHWGKFEVVDSGKVLHIYKEGLKGNLNLALISEISDTALKLTDLTSTEGLLILRKIE
jgi:hypothetical protein